MKAAAPPPPPVEESYLALEERGVEVIRKEVQRAAAL